MWVTCWKVIAVLNAQKKFLLFTFSFALLVALNFFYLHSMELHLLFFILAFVIIFNQFAKAGKYAKQLQVYEQAALTCLTEQEFQQVPLLLLEDELLIGIQYNQLMKKTRELQLNASLERQIINRVSNNIESPLVIVDANGKIAFANKPFGQWLAVEEAENRSFRHIRHPLLRQVVQDALIREVKRNREIEVEGNFYVAAVSPIFSELQEFAGAVILLHDITDLRKYQNLQKEFFGNASHELKTPISAIKGCVDILLGTEAAADGIVKEFLEIVKMENQRLETLVQDLLVINRYDFAQIKLKKDKISLNRVAADCLEQTRNLAELKGQTLELVVGGEVFVSGEATPFQQVFFNLITNAIHYSANDTAISVLISRSGAKAIIQVRDEGDGIPPQDLPHIFERFYRVDKGRARHTGGSGLGLSIVHAIVEAYGGAIEVESRLNEGTTFTITFDAWTNE